MSSVCINPLMAGTGPVAILMLLFSLSVLVNHSRMKIAALICFVAIVAVAAGNSAEKRPGESLPFDPEMTSDHFPMPKGIQDLNALHAMPARGISPNVHTGTPRK